MRRIATWILTASAFSFFAVASWGADRKTDEIFKDLEANPKPSQESVRDQKSFNTYMEACKKRAELIGELFKADPACKKLDELLPERWETLMRTDRDELKKETGEILKTTKNETLLTQALYYAAVIAVSSTPSFEKAPDELEAFLKLAPKDERGGMLLFLVSQRMRGSNDDQKAIMKRIVDHYPGSRFAEMAKGTLKRLESIGKPFQLEFKDAISGKQITIKDLRGKVVVIDFWATWCGPCVVEMPNMKTTYAKYHDKGVEFIGVSLDQPEAQGGLSKLKEFVSKNEIAWPQYYQGNGWASEFSKSWGINAIPSMFVIAPDGTLFSVEARGKLESIIPDLLEKAKKPSV